MYESDDLDCDVDEEESERDFARIRRQLKQSLSKEMALKAHRIRLGYLPESKADLKIFVEEVILEHFELGLDEWDEQTLYCESEEPDDYDREPRPSDKRIIQHLRDTLSEDEALRFFRRENGREPQSSEEYEQFVDRLICGHFNNGRSEWNYDLLYMD
jgi:hypothetical protein